jgi:molybdopterin synthase catalytic subunit
MSKSLPPFPAAEARLERQALDPAAELRALTDACSGEGAIVSFVGLARGDAGKVERLMLEHHPTLTEQSLREISAEALERFDVSRTWVVHRCGSIAPGEPIVFAAAAARHRRAAFEAADFLMDRLKTDAVFWKREEGAGGSRWIEPTEGDYADRERWTR